jgi:hypothetical protein
MIHGWSAIGDIGNLARFDINHGWSPWRLWMTSTVPHGTNDVYKWFSWLKIYEICIGNMPVGQFKDRLIYRWLFRHEHGMKLSMKLCNNTNVVFLKKKERLAKQQLSVWQRQLILNNSLVNVELCKGHNPVIIQLSNMDLGQRPPFMLSNMVSVWSFNAFPFVVLEIPTCVQKLKKCDTSANLIMLALKTVAL